MKFKVLLLVVVVFYTGGFGSAQVGDTIGLPAGCSYLGERLPQQVTLFASDNEAEAAIKRIVSASGLAQNFVVKAAGVPNAAAIVQGDDSRMILYNPFFITETRQKTGSTWAPIAILAHEIGHHLNGHTINRATGSTPKKELEADMYSGFILQRMGATLADAKSAIESLPANSNSTTHPPKTDRLAAVGSGWKNACDTDPKCSSTDTLRSPAPIDPSTTQRRTQPDPTDASSTRSGPNSCEYANDGECDEPNLCRTGTDRNDCRAASQRPRIASVCATTYGSCPMVMQLAVGTGCSCYTFFGEIPGIAR